jgi:hypothetical protein
VIPMTRRGMLAAGASLSFLLLSPSAPRAAPPATAPAATPAPAPPTGSRAEGEAYAVALELPASARPGEGATARVLVAARAPYHVNRDYPMSFRPDPASTAGFAGPRVALGEGAERTACKDFPGEACAVAVPLRFTAAPGGETRVAGVVAFSVCNADRCLIEKVPLAATLAAPRPSR